MTLSSEKTLRNISLILLTSTILILSGCSSLPQQKVFPSSAENASTIAPAMIESATTTDPILSTSLTNENQTSATQEQTASLTVSKPEKPNTADEEAQIVCPLPTPGDDLQLTPADPSEENNEIEAAADSPDVLTEELILPESEQNVAEEVQQLEALGQWEAGKPAELTVDFDFPITMNKQVEFYINFFQNEKPNVFTNWLKRSGRYLPMIHQQLEESGLPKDLAYLAMIESGFILSAYSPMHAAGLWQFISATGTRYKLVINKEVDERHDPVKSTKAAIRYLSDLYNEFGSWYLAVASYNAGEGKIRKAIDMYKTRDFWEMAQGSYLATETKRYVPMLIASIIIAKQPEKYGFTDIEFESPLAFETVDVPRRTDLKAVSLATGHDLEEISRLNRELRKGATPSYCTTYPLKVPVGAKNQLLCNLPRVKAVRTTDYKTHVVRKGENIAKICKKYGLSKTTLLAANNLRSATVSPGKQLRIPYQTTTYKLMSAAQLQLASLKNHPTPENKTASAITHTVKSGENPYSIAKQYGVSSQMIVAWNNLSDVRRLAIGQQLIVHPRNTKPLQTAALATPQKETPNNHPASLPAYSRDNTLITYYDVQGGDSLWEIAQKYNISIEQLKQWNQLAGDRINPGLRLTIKTEKGG